MAWPLPVSRLDLLLLAMVTIWGANFSLVKVAMRDFPELAFNAFRLVIASGIFRGARACRASPINEEMKLAAANAIAGIISENELHPEYIVPSVFDKRVAEAVADGVEEAAYKTGVARRERSAGVGND